MASDLARDEAQGGTLTNTNTAKPMENTNENSNTNPSTAPANAPASLLRAGQTFPLPFQVCNFFFALKDTEDRAQFINAVFSYILDGREIPLASLQVATLFDVIKRDLEALRLKRERISAQRKEAGDKGRETLRTQRELAKRLAQASTPAKAKTVAPSTAPKTEQAPAKTVAQNPVATVQKLLDQKEARKVYIRQYMQERRKDPAQREKENAGKRARYKRGKKTQAKPAGK